MERLTVGRRLASREKPSVYATVTGVPVDGGELYRLKESNGQELWLRATSIMQRYYIPPAEGLAEAIEATVRLAETSARVNRINWTDEAWIDEAKEIMGRLDGSVAALLNGHVTALFRTVERLTERVKELEEDVQGTSWLAGKQGEILSKTAIVLHGGPHPNGLWSHHNLPEVATEKLATAWDRGYEASNDEWKQTFDITTPDEDRFVAENPYREPGHGVG